MEYQSCPTLNYVYADIDGNIGYTLAGKVPLRLQRPSFAPLPGWEHESDWKGYIPFRELPRLYNPPEGIIATANNRVADPSYPYHLSDLFEPPYRIQRIQELLKSKKRFTPNDMKVIQNDVVSLQARQLIAALRDDLEECARKDTSLIHAVNGLLGWDGNCTAESQAAAFYHAFHRHLIENLLGSDLSPDLFFAYGEMLNQFIAPTDGILKNPQDTWFASLSRKQLVERSLHDAHAELTETLGPDPNRWNWGRLHTLSLSHPLGHLKALSPLFSVGPFPSPGDGLTVNSGFYRYSNPYQQIVGASLRMILSLGDGEESFVVLPSGQSGHPFSPHYKDQVELWRQGNYLPLEPEEQKDWPDLTLVPDRRA